MPKVLEESIIKQVAALAISGADRKTIGEKLRISDRQVKKAFGTDLFKSVVREIGDNAVEAAKHSLRFRISQLQHQVIAAISTQLEENNSIEAVKVALKVMGFGEETQSSAETNIQVILPTAIHKNVESETIDAEYRIQDTESRE